MNKIDLDEYKRTYSEILRARARHDEAQAIYHAEKRIKEHLNGVIAEKDAVIANKDAEIEKLRQMIASLQANNKN